MAVLPLCCGWDRRAAQQHVTGEVEKGSKDKGKRELDVEIKVSVVQKQGEMIEEVAVLVSDGFPFLGLIHTRSQIALK